MNPILLAGQVPWEIAPSGSARWFPQIAYGIIIAYFLANFVTVALQGVALRSFVLLMRNGQQTFVTVRKD